MPGAMQAVDGVSTLFHGGRVRSPVTPFATALLVVDAEIVWVGTDEAAAQLSADRRVDLADAVVLPAFVDAHVHATAAGLALTGLDLTSARSLAQALTAVAEHSAQHPDGVLLGTGWDESGWPEGRGPTPAELVRAAGDRPVYLARADLHSAAATPALLAAAGVDPEPDGLVRGAAHHAVRAAAGGATTPAQARAAQLALLRHAAGRGVACVHEMAGPEVSSADDLRALLALAAAEPLPEVVGFWGGLGQIELALELGAVGAGGDLFCDGSIGSHTAALAQPYADRPQLSGSCRFGPPEVAEHVRAAVAAGLHTGFHAIGDAAIGAVLEGYQLAAGDGSLPGIHRIEHVEMVTGGQIGAMARLGLTASVQPAFDARWGGTDGMYARRLGERAAAMNPFAALAAAGVPLVLSSDAPVTPIDPWAAIRGAVRPHVPGHGISARAAFTAHTRGGWRAAGRAGLGELAPGAPATFAVWEVVGELVVQTPDERIAGWSTDVRAGVAGLPDLDGPEPRCLHTVRAGTVIYDDGSLG